ncbi:MAG TPA: carboxymuconolactone decarboxylase family protein [Nitrospira sp.]|nr:carboxymuconolactone decarboxylase family protein [Nitrospira sp.]
MRLDNRIKELIAVGASITANCQPCLQYHTSEAQKSGADEDDILEAIEVGKMVRRGAAGKMDKFVASLSQSATPSDTGSSHEGGNCGS